MDTNQLHSLDGLASSFSLSYAQLLDCTIAVIEAEMDAVPASGPHDRLVLFRLAATWGRLQATREAITLMQRRPPLASEKQTTSDQPVPQ